MPANRLTRKLVIKLHLHKVIKLHFTWVIDNAKCILVTHVCVCVSVCNRMPALLHGPGCNLGSGRGAPVVHYWADVQSVHEFHCYDYIGKTRNVSKCLYSLYSWLLFVILIMAILFALGCIFCVLLLGFDELYIGITRPPVQSMACSDHLCNDLVMCGERCWIVFTPSSSWETLLDCLCCLLRVCT